jgi:hypothetical protein
MSSSSSSSSSSHASIPRHTAVSLPMLFFLVDYIVRDEMISQMFVLKLKIDNGKDDGKTSLSLLFRWACVVVVVVV